MSDYNLTTDHRVSLDLSTGRIHRSSLLLIFSVLFILAPKINIVSVFRVEDLVYLSILPILIWRYQKNLAPLPSFVMAYFAFIASSLISTVLNLDEVGPISFIYVARQLQYFVWFLVGIQIAAFISEKTFRKSFGFVAAILLLWLIGESLGIIPRIGRFIGASGRATLNTSGPFETAILVAIIFVVAPRIWHKLSMIIILLATQSRITTAAMFVVWHQMRPSRNTLILAFGAPFLILLFSLFGPNLFGGDSRFSQTQTVSSMLEDVQARYRYVPKISSLQEYRSLTIDGLRENVDYSVGDASFQIRAFKWALIIKSLGDSTTHFLFGWGPGAWGLAVDGHFIRFLGEGGVIGFILAMLFFATALFAQDSPKLFRPAFIAMALSCLFIDAATSSKVMSTLWLIAGYYHSRKIMRASSREEAIP